MVLPRSALVAFVLQSSLVHVIQSLSCEEGAERGAGLLRERAPIGRPLGSYAPLPRSAPLSGDSRSPERTHKTGVQSVHHSLLPAPHPHPPLPTSRVLSLPSSLPRSPSARQPQAHHPCRALGTCSPAAGTATPPTRTLRQGTPRTTRSQPRPTPRPLPRGTHPRGRSTTSSTARGLTSPTRPTLSAWPSRSASSERRRSARSAKGRSTTDASDAVDWTPSSASAPRRELEQGCPPARWPASAHRSHVSRRRRSPHCRPATTRTVGLCRLSGTTTIGPPRTTTATTRLVASPNGMIAA